MNDEARKIYRRTAEQLRAAAIGRHAEVLLKAAYMIDQLVNLVDQAEEANQALVVQAKVEKK